MDLKHILEGTGLSSKEAKVYLTLLEIDEAPVSVIARMSNLKRPSTYLILESLIEKALVSSFSHLNIKYFKAANPDKLFRSQKNQLERLKNALPELKGIYAKYLTKPDMTVYEGYNGLKDIMEDTLTVNNKELLVWANAEVSVHSILKDYFPVYIKEKVANNIWVKGIVNDNTLGREFANKGEAELRELKFVESSKFPFKNEINIYDDKVAIISHKDQIGIIIQNQDIADTQKSIFNLCYSLL